MIGSGSRPGLATLTAIVGLAGCTRDNPGYGIADELGATDGSGARGTETSVGAEAGGTTRGDGTSAGDSDTVADDGDPHTGDVDTTDTADVCAVPAPVLFDVTVIDVIAPIDPPCGQVRTWAGTIASIGPGQLDLAACANIECPCPAETNPISFVFHDLEVDLLQDAAMGPCVTVTMQYGQGEACSVDWVVVHATPEGIASRLLAASNRFDPELTVPSIGLGDALCDAGGQCPTSPQGTYELSVLLGDRAHTFEPGTTLEDVPLIVHGVPGMFMLEARFASVDSTCKERVGWMAFGTGEQ